MAKNHTSKEGTLLLIERISKTFQGKYHALKTCSLELRSGSLCAVVGHSGSGKTTLLRLIAGLERPDEGNIDIDGQRVSGPKTFVSPAQRGVGMVFQNYALFPHLTVAKNIAYGLKQPTKARIEELLQMVGLSGYENKYPHELSGGEQQRVALARTLAPSPRLLLLDEPFSNLDADLKTGIRQELRRIIKELNLTAIFITHDLHDALDIADELILLEEGRLEVHCSLTELAELDNQPKLQDSLDRLCESSRRILEVIGERKGTGAQEIARKKL
ncbi:MAG: ABC transporter ATP-binding protein [Bacteroidota bacterium]